jgi:hypothetical protein
MMVQLAGKEIVHKRLNHNSLFIKRKEVFLTHNKRKIVINFDLISYEDVIARLREDLEQVRKADTKFSLVNTLQ